MIISRRVLLIMRNISDKNCIGNQNTHFMINNFFLGKLCRLWDTVGKKPAEPGRPQMTIWRMRIACCITEATNVHSEYIILIAFRLQQWLREPASVLELVWNLVAHGDAPGEGGKWRGNWRIEWVASTLTPPPNVVYPALLKLIRTPRLPAVDWTDAPTDLNGLVRFGERRNLVSARVPSRSARAVRYRFIACLIYFYCIFSDKALF